MRSGVLLVDKPGGMTSHDVVARLRRVFGQREIGHTGTLDPMATGLMVMMLGKATRLARFVEGTEKAYEGTVCLGRATTTFDAEGDVTEEVDVTRCPPHSVNEALRSLVGEIEQTVPAFSAVKVDGERLYAKARRGEDVKAPTRQVTIHALDATRIDDAEIDIQVRCSKGTYVRTLAVQIGAALGLPAHLSRLRRTAVGRFSVADAWKLDPDGEAPPLRPLSEAVTHLPAIRIDGPAVADVRHGRPLENPPKAPFFAVFGPDGALIAVGEGRARGHGYACVLT